MSKQLKSARGFTIIEVLIVLAIAGLIMLVVFLAVPSLQRNSRNNERRSDVSHMAGLINEYIANNQGSLPTAIAAGTGATNGTLYLSNEKFAIENTNNPTSTIPATLPTTLDQMYVYTTAVCSGNAPTATNASGHSAVIYYLVESSSGNVGQCNQV